MILGFENPDIRSDEQYVNFTYCFNTINSRNVIQVRYTGEKQIATRFLINLQQSNRNCRMAKSRLMTATLTLLDLERRRGIYSTLARLYEAENTPCPASIFDTLGLIKPGCGRRIRRMPPSRASYRVSALVSQLGTLGSLILILGTCSSG